MKKLILLFSFLAGMFVVSNVQAQNCGPWIIRVGIHEFRDVDVEGDCYLRSHSQAPESTPYRDYLLANTGEIVIFNDYGNSQSEIKTGVRMFAVFPRQQHVAVASSGKNITLYSANPAVLFKMHGDQRGLQALTGVTVTEDPEVHPENSGGVELKVHSGLLLDSGFAYGVDPRLDIASLSTFTDFELNRCSVKNSDLFRYPSLKKAVFKFNDSKLKTFLAKTCPGLKLW